ncbi:MAG: hypothetical protein A2X86_17435 [Bdellovibrionales bacterium GWA2_49_15]|nr:MAG: hypothetical protein A2X86_17435 [Bdellovibrionales bacterium GWA2_49_15]HAZ13977.1 hypothetical protein [Bdellovibrionales bacterium]
MVDRKVIIINPEDLFKALGAEKTALLKRNYDLHLPSKAEVAEKDITLFFVNTADRDLPHLWKFLEKLKPTIVLLNCELPAEEDHKITQEEISHIWAVLRVDQFDLLTKNHLQNSLGLLGRLLDAYFAQIELEHYSTALNQVLASTLAELHRARHIHEKIVPVRRQSLKNFEILSKYGAGDSPGGEFFDVAISEGALAYVHFSSNSYVLNSKALTVFEVWRPTYNGQIASLRELLQLLSREAVPYQNKNADKRPALELCLFQINIKTLEVSGWLFGGFSMISTNGLVLDKKNFPVSPAFADQAAVSFKLERGGKLLIISPGVHNNSGGFLNKIPILKFALDHIAAPALKCINEIFFQLKKGDDSDFYKYDVTATVIEVSPNAIIKV